MRYCLFIVFLFLTVVVRCQYALTDANATKKTHTLYDNLRLSATQGIMFGHEDDPSYGVDWWGERNKSDVMSVVNTYPAIYGWDIGKIADERNIDSVLFKDMRHWIKEAYKRRGINTISWHFFHPDGSSPWETSATVSSILPDGKYHEAFLNRLDKVADFMKSCKVGFNTKIPIIFRPYHEHNGSWFWWGKGQCTEQDFIQLWRFTVTYLRNTKQVHNLIYAYAPDRSGLNLESAADDYFYGYPGDEYVDVIGLDNYWDVGHTSNTLPQERQKDDLRRSIQLIDSVAKAKGKIAALTETGKEGQGVSDWFTEVLLQPIISTQTKPELAWLLIWRNADKHHFYVPYKGQKNEKDFLKFYKNPVTIFQDRLNNPYKKGKILKTVSANQNL